MKRAKYITSRAGYELEFVNGAISQINGIWFGFCKMKRYKKRSTSKYTIWLVTELTTGMKVNNADDPSDEFLTRTEAAEYCRKMTDRIGAVLTSGKVHVEKLKSLVKDEYERSGNIEMCRRLYGGE